MAWPLYLQLELSCKDFDENACVAFKSTPAKLDANTEEVGAFVELKKKKCNVNLRKTNAQYERIPSSCPNK